MPHAPTPSPTTGHRGALPTPERPRPDAGSEHPPSARGMALLAAGVPLTLLLDLSSPVDSAAIAAAEGGSADWLCP